MATTTTPALYVRQLALGPMKNFVCLIGAAGHPEVAVIDPAWDAAAIAAAVQEDGKRLAAIFLTHHHFDHLNAAPALLELADVPVYAQRAEVEFADAVRALGDAVRPVGHGEVIAVGPLPVTCVHTPGHTPGSQCLACGASLFSGDTLFVNACGRCDLPGGDAGQLFESLHRVLAPLGDETTLYPGHDYGDVPVSTLGRERRLNPYLALTQRSDFVAYRLRPR
jgi:glyoxylase-like metal-dependent hydrolase (beta-lactamase superfamily II)